MASQCPSQYALRNKHNDSKHASNRTTAASCCLTITTILAFVSISRFRRDFKNAINDVANYVN